MQEVIQTQQDMMHNWYQCKKMNFDMYLQDMHSMSYQPTNIFLVDK
jgi:hypothetical protein